MCTVAAYSVVAKIITVAFCNSNESVPTKGKWTESNKIHSSSLDLPNMQATTYPSSLYFLMWYRK